MGPVPPQAGGATTGGVATHVLDVARGLAARGHEVAILADNLADLGTEPADIDGVALFPVRPASRRALIRSVLRPTVAFGTARCLARWGREVGMQYVVQTWPGYTRAMQRFRPDIIHVHHLERRFPIAHETAGHRIPLLATIHSTHSVEEFAGGAQDEMWRLIAANYRLAGHLVFVSRFVRDRFTAWFGQRRGRGRDWIVHNGVDADRFRLIPRAEARRRTGIAGDQPVIVFAGSLIARKGARLLVSAAGILRRRGQRLRVVLLGDGPERHALQVQARALGIEDSVELPGAMAHDELVHFYNSCDVFVLPSRMESFGLVFVEAMLCGCPVIGCAGVLDELLDDGRTGLRVSPDNPEALAEAIAAGLSRTWDREAIRAYARTFDHGAALDRLEEVYRSALGGGNARYHHGLTTEFGPSSVKRQVRRDDAG